MKKLFITLIALSLVLLFAACEILDMPLSAPTEDEITDSSTSSESSKETEQSETELKTETKTEEETYYGGTHVSCEYCGKLDGDRRWFIARVTEDLMVMPIGVDCFEAKAAMGAGINLHYNEVDGEERKLTAGEYILVKYNGMIMESYPVQIGADKVSKVDGDLYGESVPVDPSICNHKWILSPSVDYKFTCSYCNAIHFCTDPEDLEKVGNLNESTLIYRCRICGSEHLTTDPDSIKDIYTVEIVNAENFLILNELNHYYSAGEQVTVALETITEHYYMFYVNGVEQSPDESISDNWSVTYYTFTMPAEDVIITIEDVWVDIPTE